LATPEEVEQFLSEVKALLQAGKWEMVPRKKNLDGLASLGITVQQAKAELIRLSYRHYDRGPIDDFDRPGEDVWEFIKAVGSSDVYIKLKIDHRGCVCIGFHPSSGPTTLPYK